jgi:glycosyltransferase involved in cell wall biosynthesis
VTDKIPYISVVLPVYNEEESLPDLHESITKVLSEWGRDYEILYVDDGSRDRSLEVLKSFEEADARVRIFSFRRNFGQTAAMAAGIDAAAGSLIAFLDADGQNDPSDIPALAAKIEEGYDLVSGYREHRQDPFLTRILPSKIANFIIRWATGVHLRDYGCSLKVYRAELLKSFHLYGEMHRFIPAHCAWIGARMTELPAKHHPRTAGVSKYGLTRTLKVVLDLATVKFLGSYSTKPIYVFGSASLASALAAVAMAVFVIARKLMDPTADWISPLILGAIFMAGVAVQTFLMGLLAEIMIRIYHESQKLPIYHLRNLQNEAQERQSDD